MEREAAATPATEERMAGRITRSRQKTLNWQLIDDDILQTILSLVDPVQAASGCREVCKRWKKVHTWAWVDHIRAQKAHMSRLLCSAHETPFMSATEWFKVYAPPQMTWTYEHAGGEGGDGPVRLVFESPNLDHKALLADGHVTAMQVQIRVRRVMYAWTEWATATLTLLQPSQSDILVSSRFVGHLVQCRVRYRAGDCKSPHNAGGGKNFRRKCAKCHASTYGCVWSSFSEPSLLCTYVPYRDVLGAVAEPRREFV